MVAAAGCEILCLLVTLRWKISLHLTGMGAVVALFSLLSIAGVGDLMGPLLVAVVGSGLLASSRLYLGCHNGLQILARILRRISGHDAGNSVPVIFSLSSRCRARTNVTPSLPRSPDDRIRVNPCEPYS